MELSTIYNKESPQIRFTGCAFQILPCALQTLRGGHAEPWYGGKGVDLGVSKTFMSRELFYVCFFGFFTMADFRKCVDYCQNSGKYRNRTNSTDIP